MSVQEKGLAYDRWSFEVLKKDHVQKSKKLRRAKAKLKRKAASSISRERLEKELAMLNASYSELFKEGKYVVSDALDRELTKLETEIELLKRLLDKK